MLDQTRQPRATDGGNKVTTGRVFWHCGAYTASRKIVTMVTIPPIPYYQNLLFSVARGLRAAQVRSWKARAACRACRQGQQRRRWARTALSIKWRASRPWCVRRPEFAPRRSSANAALPLQEGLQRDYKGLHAFPSTITRDDPPITRDYPPSLLTLQGMTLQSQGIALPPF